ncbi:hypothetical protein GCM10010341_40460 [Streptomyces noursei]|nr:hypothetical protein GCM10010341_40460 [Streptomyces noursei]
MVSSTQMTTARVTKGYGRMGDCPGASFQHVGRMDAPVGARVRMGPAERVATCVPGGEAARRTAGAAGESRIARRDRCTGTERPPSS